MLRAVAQHPTVLYPPRVDRDDPKFAEAMGDTTFGQLHDGELDLSGPDGQGPCKSALALHVSSGLGNTAALRRGG